MFPPANGYEQAYVLETLTWYYYHRMRCGQRSNKTWRNKAFVDQFNFMQALVKGDIHALHAVIVERGLSRIILEDPNICMRHMSEGLRHVMHYGCFKRWKLIRVVRAVLEPYLVPKWSWCMFST